jgi:hypothetical protein
VVTPSHVLAKEAPAGGTATSYPPQSSQLASMCVLCASNKPLGDVGHRWLLHTPPRQEAWAEPSWSPTTPSAAADRLKSRTTTRAQLARRGLFIPNQQCGQSGPSSVVMRTLGWMGGTLPARRGPWVDCTPRIALAASDSRLSCPKQPFAYQPNAAPPLAQPYAAGTVSRWALHSSPSQRDGMVGAAMYRSCRLNPRLPASAHRI